MPTCRGANTTAYPHLDTVGYADTGTARTLVFGKGISKRTPLDTSFCKVDDAMLMKTRFGLGKHTVTDKPSGTLGTRESPPRLAKVQ